MLPVHSSSSASYSSYSSSSSSSSPSSSSPSSSSSSSSSSSASASRSATEWIQKLLADSELDPDLRGPYTLTKIISGEITIEQAKNNLTYMTADLKQLRLTGFEKAVSLHPVVRDFIISGHTNVSNVFMTRFYGDRLSNLNNSDVQRYISSGELAISEALELDDNDLSALSDAEVQKKIADSRQGVWLYFT